MIFVTVGAQMSFDRLVRSVDEWAGASHRRDVFAQIGPSSYRPRYIEYSQFIAPDRFRWNIERADAVVAHAGMGSIISAVELGKPILVMPRRGDLGETRNDHQLATAKRFSSLQLVEMASDEVELVHKLDAINELVACVHTCKQGGLHWAACPYAHDDVKLCEATNNQACPHLLMALESFVAGRSPLAAMMPSETMLPSELDIERLSEASSLVEVNG